MLKSIMVGLDGSPYSQTAVAMGLRWAKQFDALLVGLGIIDQPSLPTGAAAPQGVGTAFAPHDARALTDASRKVEQLLESFALKCAEAQVACKVLEDVGMPAEQIMQEAQRFDLMLLGRRTFFHADELGQVDGTLQNVLRHSPRPVIAVSNSDRPGKCVLIAYDGSLQAARALQLFESTGLAQGQNVVVLTVAAQHGDAVRCADRAVDFLKYHDINSQAHPLAATGNIADILIDQVWKLDPGLLVVGAYGQPTWREFMFGSTTRRLLKDSPVPLFLAH